MYKTEILNNFISIQDLENIRQTIERYISPNNIHNVNSPIGIYYDIGEETRTLVDNIIVKLPSEVVNIKMLDSVTPGGPHSDTSPPRDSDDPERVLPKFARTFIIPLETIDTYTIVFNEYIPDQLLNNRNVSHDSYADAVNNYLQNELERIGDPIDHITHQKYLSHVDSSRLSINTVFPWVAGDILVFDRRMIHCSNNYIVENVISRRALILWSEIKSE